MKHIVVLFIALFIYANAAAESLKIGLLQIEDSVPFYVAEKEGFFNQENVRVELVPFLSALERDSALMTCDGSKDPAAQAEPLDAQIPSKSKLARSVMLSASGTTAATVLLRHPTLGLTI